MFFMLNRHNTYWIRGISPKTTYAFAERWVQREMPEHNSISVSKRGGFYDSSVCMTSRECVLRQSSCGCSAPRFVSVSKYNSVCTCTSV